MKIKFSNIGPIKGGEVNLNDNLIILCGTNNTGKTYLAYTIFGLYKVFRSEGRPILSNIEEPLETLFAKGNLEIDMVQALNQKVDTIAELVGGKTVENLPNIFATEDNSDSFKDAAISVEEIRTEDYIKNIMDVEFEKKIRIGSTLFEFSKKKDNPNLSILLIVEGEVKDEKVPNKLLLHIIGSEITEIALESIFNNVYIAPAERTSINLFSKELSIKRNAIVEELLDYNKDKKGLDPFDLINKRTRRYPWPIRESLKIAEDVKVLQNRVSKYKYIADILEKEILKGKIKVSKEGDMSFVPVKTDTNLGIHLTASIVKSLASLVFYFRHLAQENDFIIIDEPELNLHPDNQRRIARFIARIVNAGFKVMISTHSDYIIRELNNLVMLKNNSSKVPKLMKEFGYIKDELLDYNHIGAYLIKTDGFVSPLPVSNTGFEVDTIDNEINNLNEAAEKIYFTLYE